MRYFKHYIHILKIFSAGENSPNNLVNHYQSENHDISFQEYPSVQVQTQGKWAFYFIQDWGFTK